MEIELRIAQRFELTEDMILSYLESNKDWKLKQIPQYKCSYWVWGGKAGYDPRRLYTTYGQSPVEMFSDIMSTEHYHENRGTEAAQDLKKLNLLKKIQEAYGKHS